jgi:hypothetical protein
VDNDGWKKNMAKFPDINPEYNEVLLSRSDIMVFLCLACLIRKQNAQNIRANGLTFFKLAA